MFERLLPPPAVRLSDVVCARLADMIAGGQLVPGEGLPSERELAKILGVSRPSLREALSTLRSRGLIQRARKGSVIALQNDTMIPLLNAMNEPGTPERDVMELRFGLEAYCAFLAATRATDEDLRKIESALLAASTSKSTNAMSLAKLDLSFHQSIAEASHNLALQSTFCALGKTTLPHIQLGYTKLTASAKVLDGRKEIAKTHAAIYSAICSRDADAAWLAAYSHLEFSETVWGT